MKRKLCKVRNHPGEGDRAQRSFSCEICRARNFVEISNSGMNITNQRKLNRVSVRMIPEEAPRFLQPL